MSTNSSLCADVLQSEAYSTSVSNSEHEKCETAKSWLKLAKPEPSSRLNIPGDSPFSAANENIRVVTNSVFDSVRR